MTVEQSEKIPPHSSASGKVTNTRKKTSCPASNGLSKKSEGNSKQFVGSLEITVDEKSPSPKHEEVSACHLYSYGATPPFIEIQREFCKEPPTQIVCCGSGLEEIEGGSSTVISIQSEVTSAQLSTSVTFTK